jgi:hypothetical protein
LLGISAGRVALEVAPDDIARAMAGAIAPAIPRAIPRAMARAMAWAIGYQPVIQQQLEEPG